MVIKNLEKQNIFLQFTGSLCALSHESNETEIMTGRELSGNFLTVECSSYD